MQTGGEPKLKAHKELRWLAPEEFDDYDFLEADKVLIDALKNAKKAT